MRKGVIGIAGVMLVGGFILYFWSGKLLDKGVDPQADGTNAYAIVLGAKVKENGEPSLSLQYRLETAIEYLKKYPHVKVIVSGGQGNEEPMSEAERMYTYLLEAGIVEERIIQEGASTSTYENLLFSKGLLPEGEKGLTIISSDFHLARAQYIAEKLDLEVDVVPAQTPKSVEEKMRLRERAALLKTYVMGY
ncbi:YdcF family protein [Lysinibacillus sp. NPDC097287]|uniref:YdcF family protein n=1 Tax=Lysinibacillus sp. NPDC097287 TaxID=3364144 RepID=UPI00382A52FB